MPLPWKPWLGTLDGEFLRLQLCHLNSHDYSKGLDQLFFEL